MSEQETMDLGISGLSAAVHLGAGGSANVFAARKLDTGEAVAVKLLRASADSEKERKRFEREKETLDRLSTRDGIVPILDAGMTDRKEPYFLMPIMEGSLQDRIEHEGALGWEQASQLMVQVAETVEFAHEHHVLHRDIKPGNILVDAEGVPRVADFGIAKLLDASTSKSSKSMGTPSFMPPERFRGDEATEVSDVYGLGATLAALVTGTPPFITGENDTDAAVMMRVVNEAPPDLATMDIPNPVAELVTVSMAKDPADRPASAAEFANRLRSAVTNSGAAVPAAPVTVAVPRRNLDLPMGAAAAVTGGTPVAGAGATGPVGLTTGPGADVAEAEDDDNKAPAAWMQFAGAAAVVFLVGLAGIFLLARDGSDPAEDAASTLQTGEEADVENTENAEGGNEADLADGSDNGDGSTGDGTGDDGSGGDGVDGSDSAASGDEWDNSEGADNYGEGSGTGDAAGEGAGANYGEDASGTDGSTSGSSTSPGVTVAGTSETRDTPTPTLRVTTTTQATGGNGATTDTTSTTTTTAGNGGGNGGGATTDTTTTTTTTEAPAPLPDACFTASKTSVSTDESVSFSNCSTDATSYVWSFGDGTNSSWTSPSHAYESGGTYTVRLTATGAGGDSDSTTRTITVAAPAPSPSPEFVGSIEIGDIGTTFVRYRFTSDTTVSYTAVVKSGGTTVATSSGTASANQLVSVTANGLSAGNDYTIQVTLSGSPSTTATASVRTPGGTTTTTATAVQLLNLRVTDLQSTRVQLNYESNVCANGSFVISESGVGQVGSNSGQADGCGTNHLAIPGFWTTALKPNTTYTITVTVEANGRGNGNGNTASKSLTFTTAG